MTAILSIVLTVVFTMFSANLFADGGTRFSGGGSSPAYKLSVSINGKGAVTVTPSASSYAPGTVVTLTANPGAGSPWMGWSGGIFGGFGVGMAQTITVTMFANTSLTANFR